MPAGALGRLLELGRQLCAVQQTLSPRGEPSAVVVMVADHGVAEEGVSAYPQEVTRQMAANFLRGTAAINVLARRHHARVLVANLGLRDAAGLGPHPDWLEQYAIGSGTANFLRQPAMTAAQASQAVSAGRDIVARHLADVRVLALGEMGIGNSTSASALTAALTGLPAREVTGRGTGLDDAAWQHKLAVVERALELHGLTAPAGPPVAPLDALAAVGGFEIAALAGAALEAAARRMLVLLDGFISSTAGLIAARLEPNVQGYLVAAHQGAEPGHRHVLHALGLVPLLDLGLRLGEGSGAVLALNLVQSAADILRDMATFEEAGVSSKKI